MTHDASNSFLSRLAGWLVDWRRSLLLAAIVLTVLSIKPSQQLSLDESIESFYAPGDPDLEAWLLSKRLFGGDEFVMVAYEQPDLLGAENLRNLGRFADQFRDPEIVPGIDHAATKDLASTLDLEDVPAFASMSRLTRVFVGRLLRESLIDFSRSVLIGERNEDGTESNATAVMLQIQPESADGPSRADTLRKIRALAQAHDPPAYVAGEPVQIHDMFRYVEQDAFTLGWATSALLLIVIFTFFRSARWVALPLLVVHATILWTRALLVITDLKLSMVSSMLNSLVTIVGIATVTHVTVNFRELRADHDRLASFRETFFRLAPAIFWTCMTTAIGFLALLSSNIVPVRSFGIMVALGTLLILPACAAILPGGILLGRLDADPRETPLERHIIRALLAVTERVERRPRLLLALCGLLMIAGGWGLLKLRVETDFSKNFRSSSDIAEAVTFFESKLGGAGNWEVNFPAPAVLDEEFLDRVRELGRQLRELEMSDGTRLSKVYALTDGLDFIPASMGKTIDERRASLRQMQPDFEDQLYNPEGQRMRLFLRAREQKPAEIKLALIDEVERTARQAFPEARTTGLYVMIAKLITSLLGDQLKSFLLAAAGIVICMTIAFRNLWIGVASLLPNVFPILLVIGGMGWIGVPVNIGTAMIACVSMGLTVDSSIHYLSGYRRARQLGRDHAQAIRDTHAGVGRALVFANVALIAGFTVLALSNFIPLIYFGILVSFSMLGGLLGNLVLLPLLLHWIPMRYSSAN